METCKGCGVQLIGMVLSSDDKTETISYRCPSCGDFFLKEKERIPERSQEIQKVEMSTLSKGSDKHIKVHRDVWSMAHNFVQDNKIMYPSIKFFTQQAIIEKIRKESNNR